MSNEVSTPHGDEPFARVHLNGEDVTDEPERWPWPYSEYYAKGWRPGMEWDNRFRPSSPRVPKTPRSPTRG